MEQRLKTLEDLCELITKEVVHQNKNMIEINKNLLSEIKSLREAYIKQDDDFEEFKNLLRKIYELNRQNSATNQLPLVFPSNLPPPSGTQPPSTTGASSQLPQHLPPAALNNSLMVDQVNQSMLNNLSFQSERTPLTQHNLNPNNVSAYSVPSSASAMQQQQPHFMPFMPPQQPVQQQPAKPGMLNQQAKPSPAQPHLPPFNPAQPPPTIQVATNVQQQQPVLTTPNAQMFPSVVSTSASKPVPAPASSTAAPFSFGNLLSNKPTEPQQQPVQSRLPPFTSQTTSTPQPAQFSFSKLQQQPAPQPTVSLDANKPKFQLSPAKPVTTPFQLTAKPEATTTTTTTTTSLFGSNLFKTTPEKSQSLFNTLPPAGSLMKAPEPTAFTNLFKTTPAPTVASTSAQPADDEDHDGTGAAANPEEFEPQVEFKPIVKLHEVEVKTGEEDEDVLFKTRCKLFRFDSETKEWKEKGVGEIKLLRNKQTKVIRVLMRRDQVLKLCANHRISPSMTIKEMAPKQLSWLATDFSEQAASTEMLLAKFKTVEDGNQFKQEFEKAVVASKSLPTTSPAPAKVLPPSNKPSLSDVFKNENQWKCNACYAPNNNDVVKCACCGTLKPGATAEAAKPAAAQPPAPGLFSFGTKPNESPSKTQPFSFGSSAATTTTTTATGAKPAFSFGQQQQPASLSQPKISFGSTQLNVDSSKQPQQPAAAKPVTNLFGQTTPAPSGSPQTNLFQFGQSPQQPATTSQPSVLFDKSSLPSFASLASKSDNLFGNKDAKSAGFSGGLQPSSQPPKPLFGGAPASNAFRLPATSAAANEEDEGVGNDQHPEEYEPQVEFKPLVKLHEVEVKTGEEDEVAVFKQRCKLYRYDSDLKEWKEKGTGEMKILKHRENEGMYRILMRRDQVLKLCANHRITSDLKFEIYNEKQVRWHAQDYSENEGKHETLAARFKSEEEAKNFIKEAEAAQKVIQTMSPTKKPAPKPAAPPTTSTQPSLSDVFKNDKQWKCNACYAPNNNDVVKCACCGTLKPGATEPQSKTEQAAASGLAKISLGSTQPAQSNILFGTQSNSPVKFEFGSKPFQPAAAGSNKEEPSKPVFGTSTIKTDEKKPSLFSDAASIFGNKPNLSFADLANQTKPSGFGGGFIGFNNNNNNNNTNQSPGGTNLFANLGKSTPAPVFGSLQTQKGDAGGEEEGGDEHGNPEEYEPQVDFKPLVKLNEVEVKTGEEDEEILFKARCKLFRFNAESKEWKEKGVGEIKILKHKLKENCYRVLMRRDQVLKLCANHRISVSLKLEVVNEKQLRWFVNDCSEDEPHPELLLAKFRADEDTKKFREEFEKAQQVLAANPTASSASATQAPAPTSVKNNLASAFKQTPGAWSCTACLSQNKPESDKCAACQTPKPEDKNNNDVTVINELRANPEQVNKARQFKLPDNFYLYENKPECAGCRGCEKEE